MSLFKRNSQVAGNNSSVIADTILNSIHDGIIMTNRSGIIEFINNAAITMTECGSAKNAVGLDYGLVFRIESKEGREMLERDNPLIHSIKTNQSLEACQVSLIPAQSERHLPIAVTVIPAESETSSIIITFRNIAKELEEEGEQAEFISTASHEMRTPVATIDGYLSLALNPQTATIDERARGYLAAAQTASKHLGKLFQNLLDVTRLDDGKIKLHFEPVEMVELIKEISDAYIPRAKEQKITFSFGSSEPVAFGRNHRMEQVVYGLVDISLIQEIMDNLVENALKYTPEGGSIYVNVRGDGDRVLINVTDTGIGIAPEDLTHIFQKFYRVDNSDTRTIGGNGLGLYLVKQRTEAMGGKVWAESAFGEGSTFYVSLPRLTSDEYEKRMIMVRNLEAQKQLEASKSLPTSQSISSTPQSTPSTFPSTSLTTTSASPTTPPATPVSSPAIPTTPPATLVSSPATTSSPISYTPPPTAATPSIPSAPPAPESPPPTQTINQRPDNSNNINLNGEQK